MDGTHALSLISGDMINRSSAPFGTQGDKPTTSNFSQPPIRIANCGDGWFAVKVSFA